MSDVQKSPFLSWCRNPHNFFKIMKIIKNPKYLTTKGKVHLFFTKRIPSPPFLIMEKTENPKLKLDDWQEQVLATKGHICLVSGRQVGKSTVIAMKAGEFAIHNPKKTILIIAAVERQALLLFEKVLAYIHGNYRKYIQKGKNKPTKHTLKLTNGSIIHCLPTGESGYGIRGYTIDQLYADEAHYINEDVWNAVTPMLATTGGDIILLSTPKSREGYFFRCSTDDRFAQFRVSSEDCERMDKVFLDQEKQRMSQREYAQEYLGQFVEGLGQFFPDETIKKAMVLTRRHETPQRRDYFLGVDVARMGEDESTFEILDRKNRQTLIQVENIVTRKTFTTETTREIINLDKKYDFKKIYIDDGGMGVGVFDQLLEEEQTRRKVVPINNAKRSLEREYADKPRFKKLLKEDLYNNLLRLMERDEIKLLDDPNIHHSLKSVQYEYINGQLRIFGRYTHIVEGLIRAAWCVKDKSLNIFIL
jgi:hypothetical protein